VEKRHTNGAFQLLLPAFCPSARHPTFLHVPLAATTIFWSSSSWRSMRESDGVVGRIAWAEVVRCGERSRGRRCGESAERPWATAGAGAAYVRAVTAPVDFFRRKADLRRKGAAVGAGAAAGGGPGAGCATAGARAWSLVGRSVGLDSADDDEAGEDEKEVAWDARWFRGPFAPPEVAKRTRGPASTPPFSAPPPSSRKTSIDAGALPLPGLETMRSDGTAAGCRGWRGGIVDDEGGGEGEREAKKLSGLHRDGEAAEEAEEAEVAEARGAAARRRGDGEEAVRLWTPGRRVGLRLLVARTSSSAGPSIPRSKSPREMAAEGRMSATASAAAAGGGVPVDVAASTPRLLRASAAAAAREVGGDVPTPVSVLVGGGNGEGRGTAAGGGGGGGAAVTAGAVITPACLVWRCPPTLSLSLRRCAPLPASTAC
jgi:hypothetical protein